MAELPLGGSCESNASADMWMRSECGCDDSLVEGGRGANRRGCHTSPTLGGTNAIRGGYEDQAMGTREGCGGFGGGRTPEPQPHGLHAAVSRALGDTHLDAMRCHGAGRALRATSQRWTPVTNATIASGTDDDAYEIDVLLVNMEHVSRR